jgi:glycosyltransferase involved in cell wall biosynthesis
MPFVPAEPWSVAFSSFPADGRFPAGGCWLRGLIKAEAPSAVVDVRARVGREIICGFCEGMTTRTAGSPSVNFTLFLRPPAGRHRFRLEGYDAARGCWRECFQREIESDAPAPDAECVRPAGPGPGWMLLRTLHQRHAQPRNFWRRPARTVSDTSTAGTIEIQPVPPLYGCLEEPGQQIRTNHGLLSVNGWLAHATQAVVRVTACVDPRMPARLEHGLPRGDVAAVFGQLRNATQCQFSGEVIVPASHPEPWGLVVCAELDNGEQLLAFARRVWGPPFAMDIPGQLPPYSAMRFGTAAALVLSARGWRDWRRSTRECAAARKTYLHHASPPVVPGDVHYQAPTDRLAPQRLSVLIVNDNFTLGGAAMFALEYARYLSQRLGWTVRLATPQDGPLRALCAKEGIPVEVLDDASVTAEASGSGFHNRIATMAAALDWSDVDVVIANTMVVHWAVHLAQAMGKPVLFYIHESARIDSLFPAALVPVVKAALAGATRTVFVTEWTRTLHRPWECRANFRLLRSWTDIAQLDAFAAAHDRASLRRMQGIPAAAIVVVCAGSICDRKGQRLLVQAIELLREVSPPADAGPPRWQFLLVGARPGPDFDQLQWDIMVRGLAGLVRLVDETPDVLSFLCLADIYVCPSFEEGFPRALMEAAGLGLQIVTTRVCGIPEMLREQDAWLVPPGEPALLAGALAQAMEAHRAGDVTRPRSARRRVEQLFNAADVLPEHAALVGEVLVAASDPALSVR